MKLIQKFMQTRRPKCHFQQLDAEPRPAGYTSSIFPGGPPPSYRSSTNADDSSTFSSTESSRSSSGVAATASLKRRNSWTNLIESDENLFPLRKDFPFCVPSSCATTTYRPVATVYGNEPEPLEKYNLNGRYAKHFMPFYLLNSAGDPVAVSKLQLTMCDSLCKSNGTEAIVSNNLKRDRMGQLRQWYRSPKNQFCSLVLLLMTIASCMATAILLSRRNFTESRQFSWIPPMAFRNEQKNPTTVRMYENNHQVRFELQGNLPIKNNYIAVYDFRTRKVGIIDLSLKNNDKNLMCFVMNMNISTMPDKYALEIGAQNALKRKEQTQGWEETWNFVPGPYFRNISALFDPHIPECDGARWIMLNYTSRDQRGQKCSDCYDFCVPELGLERDRLRAETFLNIVRRDCFYIFVPEWRSFATGYSNEQNQRDFEHFYHEGRQPNNGDNGNGNGVGNGFSGIENAIGGIVQPITDQYRDFESKWISLQQIPQQVSNLTSEAASQMGKFASNVRSSLSNAARNIFGNADYQQQKNDGESSYQRNLPPSSYNFNNNNNDNDIGLSSGRNKNEFGNSNGGPANGNGNVKPLLPMPPPSYPSQNRQQSSANSYSGRILQPFLSTANGNGRQQNGFGAADNGQFMLANNLGGRSSAYNPQLPYSQPAPNVLPNSLGINSQTNQLQSVYDQPASGAQANYYTPQPGIDGYIQQTTGVDRSAQNDGGADRLTQQPADQGWITVG